MSVTLHSFSRRLFVGSLVLLAACSHDGRELHPPLDSQNETIAVTTTIGEVVEPTSAFAVVAPWEDGAEIDPRYTCAMGISPRIQFDNVASDVKMLALSIVDETANGFVHWVVANIDPAKPLIEEGSIPIGAIESTNSAGTIGFNPPCPRAGESHTYRLTAYGLSQQLELDNGVAAETLVQAIELAALDTQSSRFIVTSP